MAIYIYNIHIFTATQGDDPYQIEINNILPSKSLEFSGTVELFDLT